MLRTRVDVASATRTNNAHVMIRPLFILARELARERGDARIVRYYQQGLSELLAVLWHVLDGASVDPARSPTHDGFASALSSAAVECDSYYALRALLAPLAELFFDAGSDVDDADATPIMKRCNVVGALVRVARARARRRVVYDSRRSSNDSTLSWRRT